MGTENLRKSEIVRTQCLEFDREGRYLAAICAAPSILAELGILDGKKATCHPDYESKMQGAILTGKSVSVDGKVITGQGLGAGFRFAFELVRVMAGESEVERIKSVIIYTNSKVFVCILAIFWPPLIHSLFCACMHGCKPGSGLLHHLRWHTTAPDYISV